MRPKRLIRGIVKIVVALIFLAAIGLVGLLTFLWQEHQTQLVLPQPTGHFPVGRTTLYWTNEAQKDELAPTAGSQRQVVVWLWYPSVGSASAARADYLPPSWRVAEARYSGMLMSTFLTRDPSQVQNHSLVDAE